MILEKCTWIETCAHDSVQTVPGRKRLRITTVYRRRPVVQSGSLANRCRVHKAGDPWKLTKERILSSP